MILSGIHPVAEALRAGTPVERLLVAQGAGGPRLQEIIDLARRKGTPVRFEQRSALDRIAGTTAHQGVVALGAARKYADLGAVASAEMIVVLDGVEDPHNLGAIVRTAHAAGAGAVVIPERRAASVTDVVAKAAAGALEHLPIVRVTNVNRTLEELKSRSIGSTGSTSAGRSRTTASIGRRSRCWCSAARARACTSRCASTATCWCGFRWRPDLVAERKRRSGRGVVRLAAKEGVESG